jgi:hypothetical protein
LRFVCGEHELPMAHAGPFSWDDPVLGWEPSWYWLLQDDGTVARSGQKPQYGSITDDPRGVTFLP